MNLTSGIDLTFNMKTLCRVCLTSNVDMDQIFTESNSNLVKNIEFCTGILLQKTEGLPTLICKICTDNLSIAHKFKSLCLLTEDTLQKLVGTIKTEVSDDEKVDAYDEFDLNVKCEKGDEDLKEHLRQSDIYLRPRKAQAEKERQQTVKVATKKRGPYKKGNPPRVKKYKFLKLTCETCGLKFPSKQESDEHRRLFHSENISWICEICGKTFTYRGSHYTHVKSHLPPRYFCAHCDYSCSTKGDLEKHLRIHLGIKKYKCNKCQSSFHTVSNLHDHERRQHQRLKRYHCALCDLTFYDKTKLNRHVDSHNCVKRFSCDICHSSYTRRCYWKKHLEKQHNITIPAQRPGRRKANVLFEPATASLVNET